MSIATEFQFDSAKFGADARHAAAPCAAQTQHTILVVDDTPVNLKVIQLHLEREGYERVVAVQDARQALAALYQHEPDLLLLDLMMPHVSGLDILNTLRETSEFRRLPVIIISAVEEKSWKRKSLELGASDFLAKPVDAEDLVLRVRNTLELRSYQATLETMVAARTAELVSSREEVVRCLARASEYRDNETGMHVVRVGRYVGLMASRLGFDPLQSHMMELASTLHDMGKIGIPDSVLLKPGRLTDEERAIMNEHCAIGARICYSHCLTLDAQSAMDSAGDTQDPAALSPLLQMASRIALTHHERWDGTGYPHRLRGDQIPLEGRITAVADVFDALSSRRPYKLAVPIQRCFEIVSEEAGKHFDPNIVEVFLACRDEVTEIRQRHRDE